VNDQSRIRVLSVDDHPLLSEGIAAGCRSCRRAQLNTDFSISVRTGSILWHHFAAALCHIERFVVLGATPRHRPAFGPFQLRASNGTNFSSFEIAEVIKIPEEVCLFFENLNEA